MKYFICSDIHGDYNAFMEAIKTSEYDQTNINHQLITIGDNFGRATTGMGSYGIYKYLRSPDHINPPICIRGNHEDIFLKMSQRGYVTYNDEYNGEVNTLFNFLEFGNIDAAADDNIPDVKYTDLDLMYGVNFKEEMNAFNHSDLGKEIIDWIQSMPYYFETKHYLFTHGWIPMAYSVKSQYGIVHYKNRSEKTWFNAMWCHTEKEWSKFKKAYPSGWKKWLVVGHWHAFCWIRDQEGHVCINDHCDLYNSLKPEDFNYFIDDEHKVIFCDQCTALGHKINMLILEDEEE